jgi:hypothetical protein
MSGRAPSKTADRAPGPAQLQDASSDVVVVSPRPSNSRADLFARDGDIDQALTLHWEALRISQRSAMAWRGHYRWPSLSRVVRYSASEVCPSTTLASRSSPARRSSRVSAHRELPWAMLLVEERRRVAMTATRPTSRRAAIVEMPLALRNAIGKVAGVVLAPAEPRPRPVHARRPDTTTYRPSSATLNSRRERRWLRDRSPRWASHADHTVSKERGVQPVKPLVSV